MKELLRKFDTPFWRFLIVGGMNTGLGYAVTLFLHYGLGFETRIAQALNFVICFPVAYTLQALFAFRVPWSWKRLAIYPLSNIPSLLVQLGVTTLATRAGIEASIAYLISYVVAIPVMYIVVRFLVGDKKSTESSHK